MAPLAHVYELQPWARRLAPWGWFGRAIVGLAWKLPCTGPVGRMIWKERT